MKECEKHKCEMEPSVFKNNLGFKHQVCPQCKKEVRKLVDEVFSQKKIFKNRSSRKEEKKWQKNRHKRQ